MVIARHLGAVLLVGGAVLTLAAACGGGGGSPALYGRAAFVSCLHAHATQTRTAPVQTNNDPAVQAAARRLKPLGLRTVIGYFPSRDFVNFTFAKNQKDAKTFAKVFEPLHSKFAFKQTVDGNLVVTTPVTRHITGDTEQTIKDCKKIARQK